jgi:hypothetical protein
MPTAYDISGRYHSIINWGPCENLSDVRAFLGTIGVCRLFIRNFAHRAHHLVKLTRKDQPFIFGPEQIAAQEDLKSALLSSPALRAINYDSPQPVILSVDTSYIAIGHILSQCDEKNPRLRYISPFGSITLNDREAGFSQAKLEVCGLYRSIRALKLHLIGLRNLIVEVDAKYIKGMLAHPDLVPSASINRWIISILTFHFELVHVPSAFHGPDGLLRRRPQPGDKPKPEDDFDDWIDRLHGFMHMIAPYFLHRLNLPPIAIYIAKTNETTFDPTPTSDSTPNIPQDTPSEDSTTPYSIVPRSPLTQKADERLLLV